MNIVSRRVTAIVPLKRKPKEGDQCICGALFEEGRWWTHYMNGNHGSSPEGHRPHRFVYAKPTSADTEQPRQEGSG